MIELQEATGTGLRESLRLYEAPAPWVFVLVVVPLLLLVAWASYRREPLASAPRVLLSGLRFGALLVLFLVLCRPVVIERREEVHPAEVVLLLDDSASMQRRESYAGDDAARRAIQRLTGGAANGREERVRLDLLRAGVERELLPVLGAKGYGVRMYRFSDTVTPLSNLADLAGSGHATHLGDALAQVLATLRGRSITDVVVVSDGRVTGGLPVFDAARAANGTGIPVHTVVVGDTRPERNAVVELVEAPQNALEGDELAITVRVTGRGTQDETVQVVLDELFEDGSRPRTVVEEEVELSERGRRVVLVAPPGRAASDSGKRRFRVSVPPLEDETLVDDNQREVTVPISREKIRVLYVEGYPRWEYRRLALDLLKRADENIEFQCFLLSATPDFPQESSAGLPPLQEVPTDRRTLLDSYDVILLGDVNPSEISPDPARVEEFMASLREFVAGGGGLLFQAGEFENPRTFVLNDTLRELLPIVVDTGTLHGFEGDTRLPFRPTLEDPANPHEIVRLHPDLEVNRELWEDEGGLSGFYWYAPVTRAKPGAQVLLRHPTDTSQRQERYPLLVTGYYPAGRTMFLAVDSTWRWYWRYGKRYHEQFWRNSIRWLALGRLKSGDRRYRIETPRNSYDLDERIALEARALDEDYRPSERPVLEGAWSDSEGREHELPLTAVSGRPGLYRGSFQPERQGLHQAWIQVDGNRVSTTEFEVVLPSRESQNPSPDPEALAGLSALTGGRAVGLAGLPELASEFPGGEERREPISSRLRDAWDNWGTLLVALALLSAEWILRKRLELV